MFLSCGDALYDVFQSDHPTASSVNLNGHIGGSPLNVALGLARLGNSVGYLTANSTDALGQKLDQFMRDNGIDTRHVARTAKNTSLAMVALDDTGHPSYSFYIDGGADVSLSPDQLPATDEFEVISLGSYSTVVEPIASSLQLLVEQASANTVIAYDPNVRPSIEGDPKVWWKRFEQLAPHADLMKMSDEDIEFLAPGQSVEDFAETALSFGPKWVVVTRGGDGATAFGANGQRLTVPGVKVDVIDTVGAGDTFQAAMLDQLQRLGSLTKDKVGEADMQAVLEWAIACAGVTCSRRGADLPTRNDVLEFLK